MLPYGDDMVKKSTPVITYFLIASNVLVFVYSLVRGLEYVVVTFGFKPYYLERMIGLETLLTSLFVHAGPAHIAGNMLYLFVFGRSVEDRLGPLRYVALYLVCGLAGNVLHTLSLYLLPPSIAKAALRMPLVGASGAISGVVGAYVVFYPYSRIKTLITLYYVAVVRVPARLYVLLWFIYQLVLGVVSLGYPLAVAAWAHIGGFATGAGLAATRFFRGRRVPTGYLRGLPP